MTPPGIDPLSQFAHDLISTAPYSALTTTSRPASFSVSPPTLLTVPVVNHAAAFAMLAGLYLRHDDLEHSHEISQQSALNLHRKGCSSGQKVQLVQSVESAKQPDQQQLSKTDVTLAFWHAIMHRREGDFGNSKYWYARCRNHQALAQISERAARLLEQPEHAAVGRSAFRRGWSPEALVDLAEEAHRAAADDPARRLAVALQRLEWAGLFDATIGEAEGE
jgi:hypothetical protein